jgi:hypothetical protein
MLAVRPERWTKKVVGFVDISAENNEESRCLNLLEIIKIYSMTFTV